MARKVQVILTDDVDGSEAAETVNFGLDGVSYEIDLSDENAARLRDQLAHWVGNARRTGGRRSTGRRSGSGGTSNAAKIRQWAQENGHEVPPRGRIPNEVRQAYEAAQH
ncbi:LSR2-LIKE LSR2 ANTIGEN IMMUNE PRECURSOR RESPONSE SIGNAL PLASMID LYSYL GP61 [Propionibacterium ruminifibrarum]|uniref:LSR2-LIKE LSR2 ANTIGEN IMMUNE RESPONSE SIGNAL PLASMID LYSYL GP61 n=1 Tax=Propionibacterium ruminifibrarum TaxID=1962131 RepID=A0A375I1L6_9ACTN|nr:Lsr2 family protein [Propionibacterium ruminifibrarum]SPF67996.1 LSR2-LIKE LSR2 ANTIGEN IMMUNE PRECURSOR RESPONSE SIGNAL PLASMID LYSYL GP61 [Propionibacterium ruminifibrarum]